LLFRHSAGGVGEIGGAGERIFAPGGESTATQGLGGTVDAALASADRATDQLVATL